MSKKKIKSKKNSKIDLKMKKRLTICLIFSFIILFALILKIGWLQFAEGNKLKELAYNQQMANRTITPKRGNIYDTAGNALAISTESDTISVAPNNIKTSDKTTVNKELLAQAFSSILGLDYSETLDKLNSDSPTVKIAEKVDHDKIILLENWLESNKITSGIDIDTNTKRFYPYQNLASNLIGFTGVDNQGLVGLEYSLDGLLSGTSGKIVTTTDSINGEIPNGEQSYIAAQDGDDVFLTIDMHIQSVCEKYLRQAVQDNISDRWKCNYDEPFNW